MPRLLDVVINKTIAAVSAWTATIDSARRGRAKGSGRSSEHEALRRAYAALEAREHERTLELTRKNSELAAEVEERKRVELALRKSESRSRQLYESGTIGILIADLRGNILEANETFLNMVGYTADELVRGELRWSELTPAAWQEQDAYGVEQLRRFGVMNAWEKEYIHKDGHHIPILLGAAMLDGEGDECVCFILDLTERKRAEAAAERLREQHAVDLRYRALLDTAPDAMIVASEHGKITFVNVQAETMFGYSRAELMGKQLELLIPTRFRHNHESHLARFFASPSARPMGSSVELFGLRRDGTEIPIEVSLSPLHNADGMTVSAAVRDISERKRLESASRLVNDRLVSAVESIQDAFALFDHEDRLVLCNSVYRDLIGAETSASLIGLPYATLLDAWVDKIAMDDAERARFRNERLSRRHKEQTTSFDLKLRDGRSLRVVDRLTAEGGTVKTIWDLTEDVRLAEQLGEARAAAEAASRAKSEFLSSMSHELRTPLNAILGFAQLLQRDKKEALSERHRERVGQILLGGQHLLHLIDDVLDLSRIENGAVSLSIEPLDALEVIEHVKTTLGPAAAGADLRVEVADSPAELPMVAADRTRFAQVLMNFGSNAIKYNRPAGKLTFRAFLLSPGRVRVVVSDTGHGIPLEKQAKLFQPFHRAGQETGPIEGTGIGLFITKRLAALMHGEVGFRSIPGEGSEFWIDLPAAVACEAVASARGQRSLPPPRSTARQMRMVLYVEDNPANVSFMQDLMSGFSDVELATAASAELGIELARTRQPRLVIMDINLPGLSGLDALRVLREDERTKNVPVIALSAAASERDRQRGLQAGFAAYLTKPVNVDEFIAVVDRLLE